jgi:glucose/arabinose dehydrogenase
MRPIARLVIAFALAVAPAVAAPPIERVKLPPGFEITVFAENVKDARSMALGEKGWLFVSTRSAGNVYAIRHDGKKALETLTIARGMNMPNGVALKDGNLYVAEVDRLWRYDRIEEQLPGTRGPDLVLAPKPVLVYDKYPSDRHHGWKFIRFGPDGWLYVPVGAPCNVCDRGDPYASITRVKPDGSAMEIYARGVRNSVGFDWHPVTKELWFTDNGRDMMGDDIPPDELNHAPKAGLHFGFPYCHGGEIPDPDFAKGKPCADFTPPARKFGAHVAGLGIRFYTGKSFPPEYANQLFIAEHGSWNRSRKSGYRVMRAKVEGGKVVEHAVFAEGFLDAASDKAWGRPVDIQVMPDGSLLVTDDQANAIYRIAYTGR